jgi:hypothetical protein
MGDDGFGLIAPCPPSPKDPPDGVVIFSRTQGRTGPEQLIEATDPIQRIAPEGHVGAGTELGDIGPTPEGERLIAGVIGWYGATLVLGHEPAHNHSGRRIGEAGGDACHPSRAW